MEEAWAGQKEVASMTEEKLSAEEPPTVEADRAMDRREPWATPATGSPDLVTGDDGLNRPAWAYSSAQMREYYDEEWGMPVHDERGLFERLSLEAFQAGLSWSTILRKREAFREAFAHFDPDAVATFGGDDIERLLADERIIRNRAKIEATIGNARAVVAAREEGGIAQILWSFAPEQTIEPRVASEIPTASDESRAMAKELKRRGFRFVGPTTCYALMTAVGMVDAHLLGSFRRGSSGMWPR